MGKPTTTKYLKNRFTGVVFIYTDKLVKNPDLIPCDKDGNDLFETVTNAAPAPTVPDPAVDPGKVMDSPDPVPAPAAESGSQGEDDEAPAGEETPPEPLMIGEKPLEKASKAEIIAFVQKATGVQIEDSLKVGEVRDQAEKLLRSM